MRVIPFFPVHQLENVKEGAMVVHL